MIIFLRNMKKEDDDKWTNLRKKVNNKIEEHLNVKLVLNAQ